MTQRVRVGWRKKSCLGGWRCGEDFVILGESFLWENIAWGGSGMCLVLKPFKFQPWVIIPGL